MKISIRRISGFLLLLMASLWVHPTLAYTLTYTSKYLPMVAQMVGEDETSWYESGFIDETSFTSFKISFEVAEEPLTNDITMIDITNPIIHGENPIFKIAPDSGGQVSLGKDGEVLAWDFTYRIIETIPEDLSPDEKHQRELADQEHDFNSSYGLGLCNCDNFHFKYYAITYSPRADDYIRQSRIHFFYSDTNSPEQWTVKSSYLPEPQSFTLFAVGFLLLGYRRLRAKKI